MQAVSKQEDREEVTCEQEEEYRMWGLRKKRGGRKRKRNEMKEREKRGREEAGT